MSVTKADRDLRKLKKPIREARRAMEKEAIKQGLHIFLTEGKRSIERQKRLYAQGRTRPGQVVTRTLHSRHLVGDALSLPFRYQTMEQDRKDRRIVVIGTMRKTKNSR